MHDPLRDDRLRALLSEAERAQALLDQGGGAEMREALDGIHRDLGRHLHGLLRHRLLAEGAATEPDDPTVIDADPTEATVELTDLPEAEEDEDELERWYTDEVAWDGEPEPLFTPEELASEGLLGGHESHSGRIVAGDDLPATLPGTDEIPRALQASEETQAALAVEAPWIGEVQAILEALRWPDGEMDEPAQAQAVARVQQATAGIELSWGAYPQPIQLALAGLLAAQARHLQASLAVDVGPQLALERLRRYRRAAGLPPVVGLLPERGPEAGSWREDARRWWSVLHEGLGR